jgi:signal transduction histidine kinase
MSPKDAQTGDLDVSEFLLHACHDLRTALRAIRAHTDLLLKDRQAEQVPGLEERLGFIVDGARKIDLLTDGLASYSIGLQIQRGLFQSTPMNVLVRTVLAKLDREIRANDARVTCDELPRVQPLLSSTSARRDARKSGSLPFEITALEWKRPTWRASFGHSCAYMASAARVQVWVWRFAG